MTSITIMSRLCMASSWFPCEKSSIQSAKCCVKNRIYCSSSLIVKLKSYIEKYIDVPQKFLILFQLVEDILCHLVLLFTLLYISIVKMQFWLYHSYLSSQTLGIMNKTSGYFPMLSLQNCVNSLVTSSS